jgi:aspartate aminotransferase
MINGLSERITAMSESATIAMAQAARELASKGTDVVSLSVGEPDFTTPKYIQDAAFKAISDGYHFYTPVPGIPELRKSIASKLQSENGIDCDYENILVSTGAKHSIANAVLSLVNPGDEVIILGPFWVSYVDIVKYAQGIPVIVSGSIENEFKPTASQISAALSSKTKAIMYSSPCNPSGAVFTGSELQDLADIVLSKDELFVIADEIYEYINYSGRFDSLASIDRVRPRVVTVNGFSKGFAMTGWRLGYMCAPKFLVKAASKLQGQFTSGTTSITQRACVEALENKSAKDTAIKEMAIAYERRRDLMFDLLSKIPNVKVIKPLAAFYLFPDVSAFFGKNTSDGELIRDADDLSLYLLNKAHVSTVTGKAFGAPNHLRLSFATADERIEEGLRRIKENLAKLS